jgi:hypothetical protein
MPRQLTTESAEYERLVRLAISPEEKTRVATRFARTTSAFAELLRPRVIAALLHEDFATQLPVKLRAQLVLEAARTPAQTGEFSGVPAPMALPPKVAASELFENFTAEDLGVRPGELAAPRPENLKGRDAAQWLKFQREIGHESVELAQCVLANWFAVIEHSKAARPGAKALGSASDVLRQCRDALFQGVEAFLVPREEVIALFEAFVRAQPTVTKCDVRIAKKQAVM